MNLNDTINEIFELGTGNIIIGKPGPQEKAPGAPPIFAKTQLNVMTGVGPACGMTVEAQGAGDSVTEALYRLKVQLESVNKLKAKETGVLVPGPNAKRIVGGRG